MMMKPTLVRVFADETLSAIGNPAAVFLCKKIPSVEKLRDMAISSAQPMSAFIARRAGGAGEYDVRFCDYGGRTCHICGHASLAAARVLAQGAGRRRVR